MGELTSERFPAEFALVSCGCVFVCHCNDSGTARLLDAVFGGMRVASTGRAPLRCFQVDCREADSIFRVFEGNNWREFPDADSLLFYIDKEITLALQLRRRDLFFLHAAVVVRDGAAIVLPAASGTGKSTFTLALLEHGFDYYSDELAPIDIQTLDVHPYQHSINLKTLPPDGVPLPVTTVRQGGRLHVPVGSRTPRGPARLAALVFPRRSAEPFRGLRPVSTASATARLMSHALNPLAHAGGGLDAAVTVARRVPCYELDIHDLPVAVDAVTAWTASCELFV